ncbi:unnamed protein product [Calypogeia fissa]
MRLLMTLPRTACVREDQNSAARRAFPFDRAADLTQNSNGMLLGGTKASTISEITPSDSSPNHGKTGGSSNKENISDGAQQQQSLPTNSVGNKDFCSQTSSRHLIMLLLSFVPLDQALFLMLGQDFQKGTITARSLTRSDSSPKNGHGHEVRVEVRPQLRICRRPSMATPGICL